jgi:predicted acylesterase/phospholipase RssA
MSDENRTDEHEGHHRHAIILSGGGADGAYEVGVAKALFNGKAPWQKTPLVPDVFTGTSIGSFNATFLVSQWDDYGAGAVGNLENVWLEEISRGGFRIRCDPLLYLDPRSYLPNPLKIGAEFVNDAFSLGWDGLRRLVNLAAGEEPFLQRFLESFNLASFVSAVPWERTIRKTIDFKKVRKSSRDLFVAATNWELGELRLFKKHDMTDKLGPNAIRASSAVPGFYPIATVGAQSYIDGAVLMNTPLKPAVVDGGADVLHVVYLNTDVKKMPVEALQSTLDTLYRTQIIAWTESVNSDIKEANAYNRGLELIAQGEKGPEKLEAFLAADGANVAKAVLALGKHMRHAQADRETGHKKKRTLKPVTVHRYFPPDGLDGALGFLDLSQQRIARLIDEGFEHTVSHDCEANECILPKAHDKEIYL